MSRPTVALFFFGLLLLTVFAPACTEDQIVEMESFERELLLTWIALEREDNDRVQLYNAAAQQDWLALRQQYADQPLKPAVRKTATRINLWMLNLRNAVRYEQPARAMTAINLMQNELRAIRPQMGMGHPADRLYDFYFAWQDVIETSNDPMLCLLEWKEFVGQFEKANSSWSAYLADRPRFSDTLFPGYGRSADDAEAAGLAMTRSLQHFATLLESADHTLVAEPSGVIDDLFFDYLAVVTGYPPTPAKASAGL